MKVRIRAKIRKISDSVYGVAIKRALIESGVLREGVVYDFDVDQEKPVVDGDEE